MIKRILRSPLVFIIVTIVVICIFLSKPEETQDINLSIKSLEQELKIAYKINDRYSELIGKKKERINRYIKDL